MPASRLKSPDLSVGTVRNLRRKTLRDANARLADTLTTFGNEVEEARAKLTKVKTPDELITVRLKPTLSTLENLVTVHAKALASSDQGRADQTEKLQQTLQQTQLTVDRVVEVVRRSVLAMEKQLDEFTASSRRIAESLERLVELASSEQSRADQTEKLQQTLQQTQRTVDSVVEFVRRSVLTMEKQLGESIASSQRIAGNLEGLLTQQLADLRRYIERSGDRRSHMPRRGTIDEIPSPLTQEPPHPVEPAAARPIRETPDRRRFRWWPRS